MRKLFGSLIIILIVSGGASLVWPEQAAVVWRSFLARSVSLLQAEYATLHQIRSGEIKIGATQDKVREKTQPIVTVAEPKSVKPAGHGKSGQKPAVRSNPPPKMTGNASMATPAPMPAPSAAQTAPGEAGAPETALGAILKHEVRENQAKEETFWTEERIQEALKNGAPKAKGAPCIAFCDKNDTAIEINMPKATPEPPK